MGAGHTAAEAAKGGVVGGIKGFLTATLGSAAVGGTAAGLLASGLLVSGLVFSPLGIAAAVVAGIVAGGFFGFSVLAPLFTVIGAAWRGSRKAGKASQQSVEEAHARTREQLTAQYKTAIPQEGYAKGKSPARKSYVQALEEQRAQANNGQIAP